MKKEELRSLITPLITPRWIDKWNGEVIEKMKKNNLEISDKPIDTKEIKKYALDDDLRAKDRTTNVNAQKAEVFLEWLEKGLLEKNHPTTKITKKERTEPRFRVKRGFFVFI